MNCPKCNEIMNGEVIKDNWIEFVCECGYHVGSSVFCGIDTGRGKDITIIKKGDR